MEKKQYIIIYEHSYDTLENLQLAHYKCNQSKGAMSQKEWEVFQKGGELVE